MSYDIPRPTGPYPVAYHEVLDKTGLDSCRFRIYYPTVSEKSSTWMESDSLNTAVSHIMGNGLCSKIFKCYFKDRKMPVWRNGPLQMPGNSSKLPVVLVSHGLMMSKLQYSYLSYEIASHGYLVAALDHRDGSSSESLYIDPIDDKQKPVQYDSSFDLENPIIEEGRFKQMEQRGKDVFNLVECVERLDNGELKNILDRDFDLGQFFGKLNTEKCAIVGHSFGGATVVASMTDHPRIKVGVALDAWMGVLKDSYLSSDRKSPLLFINCIGQLRESDIRRMNQVMGNVETRSMVTILGSTHLTHTDFAYFPKSRCLARAFFKAETEPKFANDVSSELMMGFIAKHLNLPGKEDLDATRRSHPDIVIRGSDLTHTDKMPKA